ncbi:MAG TPA: hypothetical protein VMA53_12935 [Stellaceae bacterium]|nr:hypothetical protein [Stellaceae bacterium]
MIGTLKPKVIGRDKAAMADLRSVLDAAIVRLRPLDRLVAVGSSPCKFNDTGNDENWRGVRVGDVFAESTGYFRTPDALGQPPKEGRREAVVAQQVLEELETRRWRELFDRAFFTTKLDDVLALLIQDGEARLIVSSSSFGEEGVYLLAPDGTFLYEGVCAWFGQRMRGEAQLLQLSPSRAWVWNEQSLEALRPILQAAVQDLAPIKKSPIAIASCPQRSNGAGYDVDWTAVQLGTAIWDSSKGETSAMPAEMAEALEVLAKLDSAGWRRLFAEAYGEIAPQQALMLALRNGRARLSLRSTEENPDAIDAVYDVDGKIVLEIEEHMAALREYYGLPRLETDENPTGPGFQIYTVPDEIRRKHPVVRKYVPGGGRPLRYLGAWRATERAHSSASWPDLEILHRLYPRK